LQSSSSNNVFSTINPFDQGEGGERHASSLCMQVVRGDQELQGGGAYQEASGTTAVSTAAEAT
jgi:hypothetical protein